MQRFIVGLVGVVVVVFVFLTYMSSQADVDLGEMLNPQATSTPSHSQPPVPAETVPAETVPAEPTEPAAPGSPAAVALVSLESVGVTPATRIPDYDRDLFGDGWSDPDGNGCDTRNDILARDLTVITTEGPCKVLTGTLADVYTGKTIAFTRGQSTSAAVQIDHIHSLSAAWRAGAHAWTEEQRVLFANDTANLLAVDGPANSSKSDKGPAEWMPSDAGNPGYDCQYAMSYTHILVKYELTAPAPDLNTLRESLALCA